MQLGLMLSVSTAALLGGGGAEPVGTEILTVTGPLTHLATNSVALTGGTPTATGGTAPYSYSISPDLPTGYALDPATGIVSGTKTTSGYYWGMLKATDSLGNFGYYPLTISCGPAATTVAPSGDTTGATDVTAINAVTSAGGRASLSGTYYLNASLVLASNAGLLQLSGGVVVNLVAQSNSNMVRNTNRSSQTRTDQNLVVWGTGGGNFYFNGLFGAQTRPTQGQGLTGLSFISVDGLTLYGCKVRGEEFLTSNIGCINSCWDAVEFAANQTINQDGCDIGPGTHNYVARNLIGQTADDVFSIFAKQSAGTSSLFGGTPWSTGADIHDLYFYDNFVAARADNYFRLQCGDGFKLYKIRGYRQENDTSLSGGARTFLEVGESKYTVTPPAITDWSDIIFDGAKGFKTIISNDSNAGDIHVKNVELSIALTALITTLEGNSSSYAGTGDNITVDGVTDTYGGVHGALVSFPTGAVESNISISNVAIGSLNHIETGAGGTTNLSLTNIVITTPNDALFNATNPSTGALNGVTITNPIATTFGTATGLTFSGVTPKVRPFDTAPNPVNGSLVTFTNGTSPTGTYQALGGIYRGNGSAWVLQGSAQNIPYPDATVFYHDTFTGVSGASLLSHVPEIGGGYTGLTGAANTTAPKINAAGKGVYAGNSNNGVRATTASPGLNQKHTAVFEFKGALTDINGFVFCGVGGAQTYYWLRWNTSVSSWQLYKFVATVATNLGVDAADTFTAGQKTVVVTTTVDNLVTPTVRTIVVTVDGVQIMNTTDTSILTAGYPGYKPNTTQTSTTGRQLVDMQSESI